MKTSAATIEMHLKARIDTSAVALSGPAAGPCFNGGEHVRDGVWPTLGVETIVHIVRVKQA
jgi:hypothetical protein